MTVCFCLPSVMRALSEGYVQADPKRSTVFQNPRSSYFNAEGILQDFSLSSLRRKLNLKKTCEPILIIGPFPYIYRQESSVLTHVKRRKNINQSSTKFMFSALLIATCLILASVYTSQWQIRLEALLTILSQFSL